MPLNPLANAFGLDIGDRSLKLIQVARSHRNLRPYRLTAWGEIELAEGVMDRGEILDMDKAVESLKQLIKQSRGRLRGHAVTACLPEVKSFIKIIEVPVGSGEADVKKAVQMELEQNVPLPLEDLYHDWQVIGSVSPSQTSTPTDEPPAEDGKDEVSGEKDAAPGKDKKEEGEQPEEPAAVSPPSVRLLIGAAPKGIVDSYVTLLERAGLVPVAMEIEATAITRASVPASLDENEAVGVLDIGATRSALIIHDHGAIQMSISIPISGNAITNLIADSLKVNFEDAETLKRECGLDANRCEDKMWRILYPLIDDITEKIRNAFRFYKIGFPGGQKIEALYLCGGGAQFREIDTVLSRKLAMKVTRGDASVNLDPRLPKAFPKETLLNYTTAIGLAMRAADETNRRGEQV